jgi:hypothetical protein
VPRTSRAQLDAATFLHADGRTGAPIQMSGTEVFMFIICCLVIGEICLVSIAILTDRPRLTKTPQDHPGEPLLRLRRLRSKDGFTGITGIFTAGVYSDGLYVSVEPLFGLFQSSCGIFVPWEDLYVSRKWTIFGQSAKLRLGNPEGMTLVVPGYVANTLANVAKHHWPEAGTFPAVPLWAIARQFLTDWVIITTLAGAFFGIFIHLISSNGPPIWFAFVLPGLFFGIILLIGFIRDAGAFRKHQLR